VEEEAKEEKNDRRRKRRGPNEVTERGDWAHTGSRLVLLGCREGILVAAVVGAGLGEFDAARNKRDPAALAWKSAVS
jgi:hypothetical protein